MIFPILAVKLLYYNGLKYYQILIDQRDDPIFHKYRAQISPRMLKVKIILVKNKLPLLRTADLAMGAYIRPKSL